MYICVEYTGASENSQTLEEDVRPPGAAVTV